MHPFLPYVIISDVHETISHVLLSNIKPENIKSNLRKFTKEPHLAGTEANKRVAHDIAQLWSDFGLEDVHTVPYEVLLSYPDFNTPNRITIMDGEGREVFRSSGVSPVIIPDEQGGKYAGHQWLAYSAPGRVTAEVVYCNRGLKQDFDNLKRMGIDLKVSSCY
ncbi:unnamed protein product [Cylicostephanus goldi]|uniref:Uncharacterized protein n=1 Tax=Cylicostephanus goldi TaxID=71465 RepID=A0A3P6R817_CYLGO|nr:unnamed protein product [Cylicostephanus goldi]